MNALFCQFTAHNGGPYFVQVFNPKQPQGMCAAPERMFTQEEFQDSPGLKRRCIVDRDEQIAQKQAIVSIYSHGTSESIEATRLMCGNMRQRLRSMRDSTFVPQEKSFASPLAVTIAHR